MTNISTSRLTNPRFWMASPLLLILLVLAIIIIITKLLGKFLTIVGIRVIYFAEYLDDLFIKITQVRKILAWVKEKDKGVVSK